MWLDKEFFPYCLQIIFASNYFDKIKLNEILIWI